MQDYILRQLLKRYNDIIKPRNNQNEGPLQRAANRYWELIETNSRSKGALEEALKELFGSDFLEKDQDTQIDVVLENYRTKMKYPFPTRCAEALELSLIEAVGALYPDNLHLLNDTLQVDCFLLDNPFKEENMGHGDTQFYGYNVLKQCRDTGNYDAVRELLEYVENERPRYLPEVIGKLFQIGAQIAPIEGGWMALGLKPLTKNLRGDYLTNGEDYFQGDPALLAILEEWGLDTTQPAGEDFARSILKSTEHFPESPGLDDPRQADIIGALDPVSGPTLKQLYLAIKISSTYEGGSKYPELAKQAEAILTSSKAFEKLSINFGLAQFGY